MALFLSSKKYHCNDHQNKHGYERPHIQILPFVDRFAFVIGTFESIGKESKNPHGYNEKRNQTESGKYVHEVFGKNNEIYDNLQDMDNCKNFAIAHNPFYLTRKNLGFVVRIELDFLKNEQEKVNKPASKA